MKNQTQNESVVNQFIIEVSLIDPIKKILKRLNNHEYRDCDIKWLDNKMEAFVKFACDTLGISSIMPSQIPNESFSTLNDHVKKIYIKRFSNLLEYFKKLTR